ncbi:metal-sensitive transcriptional regulator [Planktothrix sp. FACHB-1355]|uniref:Metal-sensitive transcriptional regulator n=1 Tax=Aerosakkonema funiforme FACHB-1375 TaxID=2949571 RepID=A0A926ZI35_9CYAN|nr:MULTISPECIES: metal-sensitive transcriptional regulator [Oscillatoriales]MBD2183710.1 metal-sensitive transcriptional regulator [Aerosakkonema funiforme FACHB-1375]MBD3559524.1 metal-sensitive transcriptional regulator [Planktothrix sp. FACHB-1355]
MIGSKDEILYTEKEKLSPRCDEASKDDARHIHTHHSHEEGHSTHSHVHSEESLRRVVNRLSRIEGHVRGIKNMVQESKPCPDVLVQIAAVRGALDRVARMILDEHLTECIARAAKEGNIEVEIEELKAALDRFLP